MHDDREKLLEQLNGILKTADETGLALCHGSTADGIGCVVVAATAEETKALMAYFERRKKRLKPRFLSPDFDIDITGDD